MEIIEFSANYAANVYISYFFYISIMLFL